MKLEIKHLAPYFPYKLKYANTKNDKIYTMRSLSAEIDMVDFGWGDAMDFKQVKPILIPLSDLEDDEDNTPEELSKCCWVYTQSLIAEHYDVFGLIPEGLAIDINTLNKQAKTL